MLLLDTCTLILLVNGEPMAPLAIRRIEKSSGAVFVSPVSAWEIGLLISRGGLKTLVPAEEYVAAVFSRPGIQMAALTPEIAVKSSYLPGEFHSDPADRLIVATAISLRIPVVTRDRGRSSNTPRAAMWLRLAAE